MRISEAATSAYKVLMRFCYGQAGPRRGFHGARLLIGKFRFQKNCTTNEARGFLRGCGLLLFSPN